MSFAWLPPACYDAELSAEFDAARNWTWYEDKEGNVSVPKSEVIRGDRLGLHVFWEYHLVHCTFMWKKMHRAVARGSFVDSLVADYGHTHHCSKMFFIDGIPDEDLHTFIKTKYPKCESKRVFA
ncbi:hypothetical protein BX600DRAFT_514357 [Xylariales sp. PMI_506]|nr:hypothetical protein BX600DRAFT_514357 [Xylariales sp. PMI_506]